MIKRIQLNRRRWRRITTRFSLAGAIALWALMGLPLSSCSEKRDDGGAEPVDLRMRIAPSVGTRVAGTAFEAGDAIGLSVVPWRDGMEQSLSGMRWEDNVKFVECGGTFIPVATPYFADATNKNTLYAYYPYSEAGFRKNSSLLDVAVRTDQRGDGAAVSDCLVAVSREVVPDGKPVPLVFRHLLSRITICLKAGAGITPDELLQADVTLKNFRTEAVYDVDAQTISNTSKIADITPHGTLVRADDCLEGLSAVLIPQDRRAGESIFYVVYNGRTMACKPASDFRFESGNNHTFTATVSLAGQSPQMRVSARSDVWLNRRIVADETAGRAAEPVVETSGRSVHPVLNY